MRLLWDSLKDALERIASVNLHLTNYAEVRKDQGQHLVMTSDDLMTLQEYRKKKWEGAFDEEEKEDEGARGTESGGR